MALRHKLASGSGWLAIGALADYAMQFLVFTLLARLVTVTELGIVAFALVLTDLGRIFVNGGRAEAMVQQPEWDDRLASVCHNRTLASAALLAVVLAVGGGLLVERYYQPGSGLPTAALALILIIEAMRTIHGSKMRREFQFRQLASRTIVGTVIASVIAVYMALNGAGVWALVVQRLVAQVVITVLTVRSSRWKPAWVWSSPRLTEISGYTRKITASRGIEVALLRMPDFLIGVVAGPIAVALFRVGARALEVISRSVVQPIQDASMSAFARIKNQDSLGNAVQRALGAASIILFPAISGAGALGSDLTVLLFGDKYAASGPIMTILAVGAVAQSVVLITGSAYIATGKAQASLWANAIALVLIGVLIVVGTALYGAVGAATGAALGQWLLFFAGLVLMRKYLGVHIAALLKSLALPFFASLAMAVLCGAIVHRMPDAPLPLRLATGIASGLIAYPVLLLLFGRGKLRELTAEMQGILPEKLMTRLPGWLHRKVENDPPSA
jgi:O-antigen/teichoic acid export membrane protein